MFHAHGPQLPFCPDSPRWLIQHDRDDEAHRELSRVRTAEDVQSGWVALEIQSIKDAIAEEEGIVQNSWLHLFKGTNLRRTTVSNSPTHKGRMHELTEHTLCHSRLP
jgi:MFS transporter, SP family, sugar:H+ symporter